MSNCKAAFRIIKFFQLSNSQFKLTDFSLLKNFFMSLLDNVPMTLVLNLSNRLSIIYMRSFGEFN